MALQVRRADRDEERRTNPEIDRRFGIGVLAGVAPHLGLTTLVLLSYSAARSDEEHEFAIMPVFLELFLTPGVLVLVLVRAVTKRTRSWAKGLFGGTGLGLILVAMLIAWHSNARGR